MLIYFSSGSAQAQNHIIEAEELVRKSKVYFKKFAPQTRQFDRSETDLYNAVVNRLTKEFNTLEASYLSLKRQRPDLFGMDSQQRAEFIEQRTRLLQGREIQDSNAESLKRTQRNIHESITIGEHTSIMLEEQTEQMINMRDSLHQTDGLLDKSKAVLRRMNNRIVTNKLITGVICILELAIFLLVIYIKYYS